MFQTIPDWIIFCIGFIAQVFFSLRTLLQWFKSEKAKEIVSPSSYWVLSVLGAYIMFFYGVMRNDFSIILGQLISYYIYLWNLNAKNIWKKFSWFTKILLLGTPIVAIGLMTYNSHIFVDRLFFNDKIPFWLLVYGSAGQIIFTLRFVYQWGYSKIKGESLLPIGFWIISLIGSGVIISYGIFRADPVLILGQSFGFIAYIRNLMLGYQHNKAK